MQNKVSEFVCIKLLNRLKLWRRHLQSKFISVLFFNGKKTEGLQDVEEGAGQNQECVQYAN